MNSIENETDGHDEPVTEVIIPGYDIPSWSNNVLDDEPDTEVIIPWDDIPSWSNNVLDDEPDIEVITPVLPY